MVKQSRSELFLNSFPEPSAGQLGLAFFVYAAGLAFFIQLILLPFLLPQYHGGNGLLVGGDWLHFHQMATQIADRIRSEGWGAWELRPRGQAPAGIAALVYALTLSKPWVMIPLNAFFHACSGVVLVNICKRIFPEVKHLWLAALPFIIYPSAMFWVASIHKDGYQILGYFCFLYGWLKFADSTNWTKSSRLLSPILYILTGSALVWIVRPYAVQMMQGTSIGIALLLIAVQFYRYRNKLQPLTPTLLATTVMILMIPAVTPFTKGGLSTTTSSGAAMDPDEVPTTFMVNWTETPSLPRAIDDRLRTLMAVRVGFRVSHPEAASNIDLNIQPEKAIEVIGYLPRAAQIGYFAPFPNAWFGQGSLAANTSMRRITGLEMIGIYIAYLLLIVSARFWFMRPEGWITIAFASAMLLIYSLVVCNVGTLYRMRYGLTMLLVALGIAALIRSIQPQRDASSQV